MYSSTSNDTFNVYRPTTERVARTLINSEAYLVSKNEFFTWKSGVQAPVYTNYRVLYRHPGVRSMVKKALSSAVLSTFGMPDYVIGVAEAGIVWSTLVADELHTRDAFVRKHPKQHGVGGLLAGVEQKADRPLGITAVFVDDLVASGESLERAINIVRTEADIEVVGIASIVNWGFVEMRDCFREMQVPAVSLVSFSELLDAAKVEGKLTEVEAQELRKFYQNPRSHKWNDQFFSSEIEDFGV